SAVATSGRRSALRCARQRSRGGRLSTSRRQAGSRCPRPSRPRGCEAYSIGITGDYRAVSASAWDWVSMQSPVADTGPVIVQADVGYRRPPPPIRRRVAGGDSVSGVWTLPEHLL